jgi:hypothetical protein
MIFILVSIVVFQSFIILKIYLSVVVCSAIFIDMCYKFSKLGYPVCIFLKRYATPEFFSLIGNSPFEAFFSKASGPAVKAIVKPMGVAVGVGLSVDYVASTTGMHQLAQHAMHDAYNNNKTTFKYDATLNKNPYLDSLIKNVSKK